jgi:hypothetical protein
MTDQMTSGVLHLAPLMKREILRSSTDVAIVLGNPSALRVMTTDVSNNNVGVVDISTSVLP